METEDDGKRAKTRRPQRGREHCCVCVRGVVSVCACVFRVILQPDGWLIYGIDLDEEGQAGSVYVCVCVFKCVSEDMT